MNLVLTVPGGLDYDLELYGSDFSWLAGSYHQAGENEVIHQVVAAGDYFIRVYGYPEGRGAYSPSQAYQLSANAAEVRPPGPLSGLITNAVSWSGVVELTGDVTIIGGGSLTIMPGTQVRTASGDDQASGADSSRAEIILNGGILDASGRPMPHPVHQPRPESQPGDWYGLRIVDGDVTLRHFVVEYAVEGIRFEDGDTRFNSYTLEDGTVQRCSGNGVEGSSGDYVQPMVLSNFQLLTNNGAGLSTRGPVEFRGGRVEGNTGDGLYVYQSSLLVTGALVDFNGGCGIRSQVSSSMSLSDCTKCGLQPQRRGI